MGPPAGPYAALTVGDPVFGCGSPSHTARAAVGRCVGAVKRQVRAMEWQRVSSDGHLMGDWSAL
jgi:hypothetical protein